MLQHRKTTKVTKDYIDKVETIFEDMEEAFNKLKDQLEEDFE